MKTLKKFDYDLWAIEESGVKRFFARVKATGEETEISLELMRYLMTEEKRMRREYAKNKEYGTVMSLDAFRFENELSEVGWLIDRSDFTLRIAFEMQEEALVSSLTYKQSDVYARCIKDGQLMSEYAEDHGISKQAVMKTVNQIREKAKIFFRDGLL